MTWADLIDSVECTVVPGFPCYATRDSVHRSCAVAALTAAGALMPDDFAETLKELAKENCATAALLQEVQEVLEALAAFPCNDCGYTTVHDDHCRFAPLLDKITEDTR